MTTKLKPCPFCGDKNPLVDGFNFGLTTRVVCLKCFVDGPPKFNEKDAISAWNRRPRRKA